VRLGGLTRRGFYLVAFQLCCFAVSQQAQCHKRVGLCFDAMSARQHRPTWESK